MEIVVSFFGGDGDLFCICMLCMCFKEQNKAKMKQICFSRLRSYRKKVPGYILYLTGTYIKYQGLNSKYNQYVVLCSNYIS